MGCEVLTPSHLIYGRRLKAIPADAICEESEDETDCSRRYRYLTRKNIDWMCLYKHFTSSFSESL